MLVKLDHFPKFCTSCHHLASLLPQKLTTWNLKMMFPILGTLQLSRGKSETLWWNPPWVETTNLRAEVIGRSNLCSGLGLVTESQGMSPWKPLGGFSEVTKGTRYLKLNEVAPCEEGTKILMNLMRYFKSSYDFSLQVGPFVGHRHARSTKKNGTCPDILLEISIKFVEPQVNYQLTILLQVDGQKNGAPPLPSMCDSTSSQAQQTPVRVTTFKVYWLVRRDSCYSGLFYIIPIKR